MEVHAARAGSDGWAAWDERWAGEFVAVLDLAYGHGWDDPPTLPASEHVTALRRPNPAFERHVAVVADGDLVLGAAKVGLPLLEDPALAHVELLGVHPDHRRRGVGTVLADWVRGTARDGGRVRVAAETDRPPGESGWPGEDFARRQGLRAALTTARRELRLPVAPERLVALRAEAAAASAGYAVEGWAGPVPDADRAGRLGLLMARMSTDAPHGDAEAEAQTWDADRVLAHDRRLADLGRRTWTAVAVHADGTWVGYSQLQHLHATPGVLHQEDTLVLREHRGHRLGLLLKLDTLARATAEVPAAGRVVTWNADSNAPVVAVNDALGFAVAAHGTEWLGPV